MPSFDCNHTIKLTIWNVPAGTYKLDFSQYESFPEVVSIIVKDNFTKTEVDVRKTPSYEFAVTSDVNSYGNNRFTVNFSAASINTEFKQVPLIFAREMMHSLPSSVLLLLLNTTSCCRMEQR